MRNVIVLGSGCAGLTAAIYAARANLQPLVVEGWEVGGQLSLTTAVENFPGFPEGVQGPDLIRMMKEQAARFGAEYLTGSVTEADLSKNPFRVVVDGQQLQTKALIIATGASARLLGLEAEKKLMGHGVSTCATCDGFFFRGKKVLVVGGGDSAMEEGTFLTKFATSVTIAHRREQFRASKIMLERARKNERITFLTDTVVEDILDPQKQAVEAVKLRNVKTKELSERPVDGVFIAIGHNPNSAVFRGQLEMDPEGYLKTQEGSKTNVPGVFACGDVQDRRYRQAVTAAGSGCMAAMDAEKWLEHQK